MPINGYKPYVCFNYVVKLVAIFSFILEQHPVQYIQKLHLPAQSVKSILTLLQQATMTGLVFLNNHEQPIIAFNPATFCIVQNEKFQYYTRDESNQYIQSQDDTELAEFIVLQNSNHLENRTSHGFHGGYIGFIGYDYAASQSIDTSISTQPALYIGKYLSYLTQEHDEWYFYSQSPEAETEYLQLLNILTQQISHHDSSFTILKSFQPRWPKSTYFKAFEKIQDYIKSGDCYQINLTQEFQTECRGNLLSKADQLWHLTNAPYAGYLQLDDFELLSCSPELFIEFNEDRQIKTRPIKGTMPRFDNAKLDQISKQKLQASEKDQAENVMIVDLLRNDLSIYAEIGSVKTTKLFEIESFNQVHHMVSEITATLQTDVNPFEVLLSALPGGSITGAPKIRAMQIIHELEGQPRGAYCGSLGYFNFDGTGCWNILIRSLQKYQNQLSLWAGGGITIASNPEAEYQECFDKVSAMLNLINTWQSIKSTA